MGKRAIVTGNTLQNSPASAQVGFAIQITPRNQDGKAPFAVVNDIEISGNTLINVGSGFNIAGRDSPNPSLMTERILIRNNLVGVTGLNGSPGRVFQFVNGGSDYTIDHNTVINTAPPTANSSLGMADTAASKVNNLVFTNNLSTHSAYGFFGSGSGEGTAALNGNFTNWTFSKNVVVGATAAKYPAGNFFPTGVAEVRFANYAGGNFFLAPASPYKNAGTDGADIGARGAPATNAIVPNPPANVVVK